MQQDLLLQHFTKFVMDSKPPNTLKPQQLQCTCYMQSMGWPRTISTLPQAQLLLCSLQRHISCSTGCPEWSRWQLLPISASCHTRSQACSRSSPRSQHWKPGEWPTYQRHCRLRAQWHHWSSVEPTFAASCVQAGRLAWQRGCSKKIAAVQANACISPNEHRHKVMNKFISKFKLTCCLRCNQHAHDDQHGAQNKKLSCHRDCTCWALIKALNLLSQLLQSERACTLDCTCIGAEFQAVQVGPVQTVLQLGRV
jgi:hypothetical protein